MEKSGVQMRRSRKRSKRGEMAITKRFAFKYILQSQRSENCFFKEKS